MIKFCEQNACMFSAYQSTKNKAKLRTYTARTFKANLTEDLTKI